MRKDEKLCREVVTERCGGNCERCGKGGQVTMHHRKKRGQGGPWTPENIVAVCGDGTRGCHGWIEANPKLAHETGWSVKPWENEADIIPQPLYLQKPSLQSNFQVAHTDHIDMQDHWDT